MQTDGRAGKQAAKHAEELIIQNIVQRTVREVDIESGMQTDRRVLYRSGRSCPNNMGPVKFERGICCVVAAICRRSCVVVPVKAGLPRFNWRWAWIRKHPCGGVVIVGNRFFLAWSTSGNGHLVLLRIPGRHGARNRIRMARKQSRRRHSTFGLARQPGAFVERENLDVVRLGGLEKQHICMD